MKNGREKGRIGAAWGAVHLTIFAYCLTDFLLEVKAAPINTRAEAIEYLTDRYGYMSSVHQKRLKMSSPRCGVPDMVPHKTGGRMERNTFRGSRWKTMNLTYKITNYPANIDDQSSVDEEIARAFRLWSQYTNLSFSPKSDGEVNIEISFYYGDHGDGDEHSFDGPGAVLAHAFFPEFGGAVHFDKHENWTIGSYHGINLYQVAAHEFGHALGLEHSDVQSALMFRYYTGYKPNLKLDEDDISGITALYGRKTGAPPKICEDPRVDAMFTSNDGHTYAFKGDHYWKLKADETAAEHPRLIFEKWIGLPGNIDAAFTYKTWTYFFKGSKYWKYGTVQMDGKPFSGHISQGFPGVPDNIDTATVRTKDGELYFFKGDKFWRFGHAKRAYPEPISSWKGLPSNLDAAVVYKGKTFFFKGDGHYRFNDDTLSVDQVDPAFPRPNGGWFDCTFTDDYFEY